MLAAAGLGGQGGGPGHPGVDLDDVVAEGLGVQGELDVAASLDLQCPDQPQGAVPQEVVLLVGEGLAGGHHDGVAGVDAHRVDVLHVAYGDGGVVGVPHHLVLDLLVALDALLDEHLVDRGELQGVAHHVPQLSVVGGEAAAGAPQGEGRAQYHRVADLFSGLEGLLHGVGDLGGHHRLPQREAQLLEQLPVLRLLDALVAGAQQLHAALVQHPLALELHGQVQPRLSADAGDDGVGPLKAQDLGQILHRQGLHVHLVRHGGVGHDGGGVGVGQDHLVPLLLQGQAGLGAGVVELRRLADDDGPGADDQDLLQVCPLRHGAFPPPSSQ